MKKKHKGIFVFIFIIAGLMVSSFLSLYFIINKNGPYYFLYLWVENEKLVSFLIFYLIHQVCFIIYFLINHLLKYGHPAGVIWYLIKNDSDARYNPAQFLMVSMFPYIIIMGMLGRIKKEHIRKPDITKNDSLAIALGIGLMLFFYGAGIYVCDKCLIQVDHIINILGFIMMAFSVLILSVVVYEKARTKS